MGVFRRWVKSKESTKTAYWYVRYSINGKDKWESVGKVGEVTKAVAEKKLQDIKRKINMGVYEYQDEKTTLESLENEYIHYVKETKKLRTWKDREFHLQTLKAYFKDKTLNQITSKDIDEFKQFRLQSIKVASVNRELATLRHIYNLARRWKKFYGENPVSVSGLMPEDNKRDRVLSIEEEKRLLDNSALHLRPIILTSLHSGLRKGELLSLQWVNVDFDNNIFIIKPSYNKSKKLKKVPINSYLRTILLELKLRNSRKSEYVFLGDDDKPVKDIKTAFNNACKRASIDDFKFHDLRHTSGTRLLESEVGIELISKILGHSSVELTMKRYLHPEESLKDSVEKLVDFEKSCSKNGSNENYEN